MLILHVSRIAVIAANDAFTSPSVITTATFPAKGWLLVLPLLLLLLLLQLLLPKLQLQYLAAIVRRCAHALLLLRVRKMVRVTLPRVKGRAVSTPFTTPTTTTAAAVATPMVATVAAMPAGP